MDTPLSFEAVRVLSALIEKDMTTPEYYPMTLNALRNACNQKSNRNPVVAFGESDVLAALDELMRERLVGRVSGAGSRAVKYRHAVAEAWELLQAERAVLGCLGLRGAQTVGEIRSRTGRMHAFQDMAEVQDVLTDLASREDPLVVELARMPGQKEQRFTHLLQGEPAVDEGMQAASFDGSGRVSGDGPAADRAEIDALRQEVDDLRDALAALESAFGRFRRQFE